jgi:hypothetical protein
MADNSRCPLQVFQEKLSFASHPKSFLWSLLYGNKTKNFSRKSFPLPSGLQLGFNRSVLKITQPFSMRR